MSLAYLRGVPFWRAPGGTRTHVSGNCWVRLSQRKRLLFSALAGAALLAMWATGCGGDGAVQAVSKDIDVVALMEQLESTKSADRLNALIELGDGRENSAPALDAILEVLTSDKDAKVREMAAYVLLQMGEKAAKPAIATLKEAYAKEKNPTVKLNIVNAWNAIEPESSPSQGMNATGP